MVQVLAETRYAAVARTREEVLDDSVRGLLEQVASAPAVQRYVRRLRTHTERVQYEGGLDLILAGICLLYTSRCV